MKLQIPHKPIILNLLIFILIAVEIAFIVIPNISKANSIKQDIDLQYIEVDKQLKLGQTTKLVTEELAQIKPFLESLSAVFLKKEDQLEFITTLENLASSYNLEITITLPDIPENAKSNEVIQIPLTLGLAGSYPETIAFMNQLEKLDLYINIIDLGMNAQTNATNEAIIRTNLRANTYWKN